MDKVIIAFESDKNCARVRDILESSQTAECIVCRSGAEVKRQVQKLHITTVVCGFKLTDCVAESLFGDLPDQCAMLIMANQDQLEMCGDENIFQLPTPASKGDMIASVRMLLQFGHRMEKFIKPQRNEEEQTVINQAKAVLIGRNGMTEEQAHRFLQKRSMDTGSKMIQTAQLVLHNQ